MKTKFNKFPIGISSFKEVIENNYYYVDKTLFIQDLLDAWGKVVLFPRPRRFGKTLNISTLKYFFEKTGENKEHLFKGLAIHKTKIFTKHFSKYPVIFLTFKDIKAPDFESSIENIYRLIRDEFLRHEKGIHKNASGIAGEDLVIFERILTNNANTSDYTTSLKLLSKLLYLAYDNTKAIVLIDEYDTPIQAGYSEGYYEEIINFFKPFLGSILKDNDDYLEKAALTGILRVSKESIFSDLNNIEVYTILENSFATHFGFTLDECKKLLDDFGMGDRYDAVLDWYNGYTFGDNTILNPWSVINFVNRKTFDVYWANTSSNDVIRTLVENSLSFKRDLELLLKGENIERVINSYITFRKSGFDFDDELLYSFLFFSGYLKYTKKRLEEGEYTCSLAIVNREVSYIFNTIIKKWTAEKIGNYKINIMLSSLTSGDMETFEEIFSEFIRDTLSYFDTAKTPENVYHAFLLGLLVNLTDYEVASNREAGYGRVDIMVYHKTDRQKPAIIMELKKVLSKETPEIAIDKALAQIIEKDYMSRLKKKGYKNIIAFGLVVDGEKVWL